MSELGCGDVRAKGRFLYTRRLRKSLVLCSFKASMIAPQNCHMMVLTMSFHHCCVSDDVHCTATPMSQVSLSVAILRLFSWVGVVKLSLT